MSEEQFDKENENVDVAIESTLDAVRAILNSREVATIAKLAERARLQTKRIRELEKSLAAKGRGVSTLPPPNVKVGDKMVDPFGTVVTILTVGQAGFVCAEQGKSHRFHGYDAWVKYELPSQQ